MFRSSVESLGAEPRYQILFRPDATACFGFYFLVPAPNSRLTRSVLFQIRALIELLDVSDLTISSDMVLNGKRNIGSNILLYKEQQKRLALFRNMIQPQRNPELSFLLRRPQNVKASTDRAKVSSLNCAAGLNTFTILPLGSCW